jgi:threonine synthase
MNEGLTGYACIRCGTATPFQLMVDSRGCLACWDEAPSNLRVAYADKTRREWDFAARNAPPSLWRYDAMLPLARRDAISLIEGMTPLLQAPAIGRQLGVAGLLIKDETRNPTGSYKDRFSTVAISAARQLGANVVATSSSGNAGASLAAYAARAGLPCVMVTFAHSAGPMLAQARKYGGMVLPLTSKVARWPLLAEAVEQLGWFVTSPFRAPVVGSHPIGIEGYKTMAYEIAEQMNGNVPDWCVMPVCYGDALAGMWQGFLDLYESGAIKRLPKMVAAEVFGTLRAALTEEVDLIEPVEPQFDTLAISIGTAQGAFQALQTLRGSGGLAVPVGNDGLIRLQEDLAASEGIFAELSSVTPFVAISSLRSSGAIRPRDTVLAVVTATGLKDLDRSLAEVQPLPAMSGTLDNALDYLGRHYGFGKQIDRSQKILQSAG